MPEDGIALEIGVHVGPGGAHRQAETRQRDPERLESGLEAAVIAGHLLPGGAAGGEQVLLPGDSRVQSSLECVRIGKELHGRGLVLRGQRAAVNQGLKLSLGRIQF